MSRLAHVCAASGVPRPASVQADALRAIAEGLRQAAEGIARIAVEPPNDGEAAVYTSTRRPAGMSRTRFARRCRELARRGVEGVSRCGRTWIAARALFDERTPIRNARQNAVQSQAGRNSERPWSADQALREAGARRGAL
jgi:hypothetical protein